MIDIVFNNFTKDKTHGRKFFEKIIDAAVKVMGINFKTVELSMNLVGEQKIKELNKKHRGKNQPTDVLSFPLQDEVGAKSTGGGIMYLGDIFICSSVAKKDAERMSGSLSSELAFLAIHGFLHLLGYDNEKSITEKKKMFSLQDKILSKISF